VFENRVVRRIFGSKRFFIICTHPQISLGKSRRMRWAGHVARIGEERKVYKVLVGKPEGKRPLGRPSVGGKMGSEWILRRLAWGVWIVFDCLGTGTGGGLL
jgi:hypothetical protein